MELFSSSAYQILIVLAFAIIGAGLKYIDDAFDEDMFSKRAAMLIAPILVIIWTCLSISDSVSATILFSILFAVLLTGKIDNLVFKASSIALILILVLSGMLNFLWIPLFTLIMMGVADEKGNDYVDNHATLKVGHFFFSHRFSMKIGVLGLCMFSLLPWLYLGAFLAFDGAYESVKIFGKISVASQKEKKTAYLYRTTGLHKIYTTLFLFKKRKPVLKVNPFRKSVFGKKEKQISSFGKAFLSKKRF